MSIATFWQGTHLCHHLKNQIGLDKENITKQALANKINKKFIETDLEMFLVDALLIRRDGQTAEISCGT